MITIYGVSASRAIRSLWAIEETGVAYEHVATHYFNDSKTQEYQAVNPNGRIPALVDGETALFESMAINLYLTKHYAPALYPTEALNEAKAIQWSVWAISEIEPLQMQIVVQKFFTGGNPDQVVIDAATESLGRPLAVLEQHLADSEYLVGSEFCVADLNLAGVMLLMKSIGFDFGQFSKVDDWLNRCWSREALARAQSLD